MQKANELPQSKLSHCKIRLNIADVRTVSVVEQHIRTVSALSVLPTYSLHNLRPLCVLSLRSLSVVSVLPPRLDVHPLKCHPYCVRHVRTLTTPASVAIRCYPRAIWANLSIRCCIRTGSVLSIRKTSSVLYPLRSAASVRKCERGIRTKTIFYFTNILVANNNAKLHRRTNS